MAWDSTYKDASTLAGTIVANMGAPPGEAAGTAWIKNGESAEQTKTNRPHQALAENCDLMRDALGDSTDTSTFKAITQIATLTAFTGSSITVNPLATGGSDVEFSSAGYLYLGNATYSAGTQEHHDTLFQLLDEDYNEVMVDGVEVKITDTSPSPAADLGVGFYNAGVVTLTLTKTVPTGNYRLAYAKDTILGDLPDDALIRADIRGVHEAAAESGYKSFIVCAVDTTLGPADYIGASALEDALDDIIAAGGNASVFLRPGAYTFSGGYNLAADNVLVQGDSTNLISGGAALDFTGGAYDLTISGPFVEFRNVLFEFTAGNGIRWTDTFGRIDHAILVNGELDLESGTEFMELNAMNVIASGTSKGLILGNTVADVKLVNCTFETVDQSALYVEGVANRVTAENCKFTCQDATCFDNQALLGYSNFNGCEFTAADGLAFYTAKSKLNYVEFHECRFESVPGTLTSSGIVDCYVPTPVESSVQIVGFYDCYFTDDTATVRYQNPAFRLISVLPDSGERMMVTMENCSLRSDACGCNDGLGGGVAAFDLYGVMLRNCMFNAANMASMYEDGPLFRFEDCRADTMLLLSPGTVTSAATVSNGMVEVLRGTEIHDLKVFGGVGEFNRPLIDMTGDGLHNVAPPFVGRQAIIDGLEVLNYGAPHWTNAVAGQPLVVRMNEQTVLQRFRWDWTNIAGENGTSSIKPFCLIQVAANDVEISGCEIYPPSVGTTRWLQHVIHGDGVNNAKIFNNVFKIPEGRSADVGMRSMIRFTGATTGEHDIRDNWIGWYDDAVGTNANESIISFGTNVRMCKVVNNHMEVDDISAGTGIVVYFDTNVAYPTGAGGTRCAGGVVQGNTFLNKDSSALNIQPDIYDASGPGNNPIGYSDNLRGAV